MSYIFEALKCWRGSVLLQVEVESPEQMAHDKSVSLIQAAAAKSASGDTLFVMITNNAESDSVACMIDIQNFNSARVAQWGIIGNSPQANNDAGDDSVRVVGPMIQSSLAALVLPPHAIAFLQIYSERATSVTGPASHPAAAFAREQNYPNPLDLRPRSDFSCR